jgi:methylamine--corrinoid protein Co-methyltransferase
MLLYESAVSMICISASGASYAVGPRSAGGRLTNYVSPLECKFCGEVLKGSAGMKLGEANEIAKVFIPRYEAKLAAPPDGKSFTECFDLKTLKPTKEWREIYDKVKKELVDFGVPLKPL